MLTRRLCALAAVATCASTTAAMAATQVNIADPKKGNRAAQVEVGGRLAVQEVPPTSFFHAASAPFNQASGCVKVAAPPAGQALIVRQVRLDVYSVTGGTTSAVYIFANATCAGSGFVASVHPATQGLQAIVFDPGVAIASGSGLGVQAFDSVSAYAFVDGYTVAGGVAPAGGQAVQVSGKLQQ